MGWLEEYFASWNRGDADAVASFMSEDVDYRDMAQDERWVGKEAVRAEVRRAHGLGLTFELQRSFEGPEHFCAEWVMRPWGIPAVSVGLLEDGLITAVTDYWNRPRADPPSEPPQPLHQPHEAATSPPGRAASERRR